MPPPALAPEAFEIAYRIMPGDTLLGISRKYLRDDVPWQHLRAINLLSNADVLKPGDSLRIPVRWLRRETAVARVISTAGDASSAAGALRPQGELVEGDQIRTGTTGVAVIQLPDGTRMQIAPESQVRIERLRRAPIGMPLDAELDVGQGEVRLTSPDKPAAAQGNSGRRIEVRTPKATAAVRGTDFRVSAESERATSSVLTGIVDWRGRAAGPARALSGGFGSCADASGQTTEPEALLPGPALSLPDRPLRTATATLRFAPVPGAAAYRVILSGDEKATSEVTQQLTDTPTAVLTSQRDGPYFLTVRPISRNGVEGFDSRGQLAFAARPFAPDLRQPPDGERSIGGAVRLQWTPVAGVAGYRVQVAADRGFAEPILSRDVTETRFEFIGQEPARPRGYFWRVLSLADDGHAGPPSPVWQFTEQVQGPVVDVRSDGEVVDMNWSALSSTREYRVRIEPRSAGATQAMDKAVPATEVKLDDLAPGVYETTAAARFDPGVESLPGPQKRFEVPILLRDGSGNPVRASGQTIQMQPGW
ncbi:MAG: FecR domain-containing protein [Burkholderiaceae bacterium]